LNKHTLRGELSSINGKKILILDACFAGKDVLDTTDIANDFGRVESSIMTFASSRGDERSYADEDGSFFTRALVEGLRGLDSESISSADRDVTSGEMAHWAKRRVLDLIKRTNDSDRRQTPFLVTPALWDDEIRFAIVP
jgi:hypothetical protein